MTVAETSTISKTDLARRTRQVVDQARRGNTIIVESYGDEQVVVVDAADYRLLRAVVAYFVLPQAADPTSQPAELSEADVERVRHDVGDSCQPVWDLVVGRYLDGHIDVERAAKLLGLSAYELEEHFRRLEVPRAGEATTPDEGEETAEAPVDTLVVPEERWRGYGVGRQRATRTQAWLTRWSRGGDDTGFGSG
jgi:prevent-host-death family protein